VPAASTRRTAATTAIRTKYRGHRAGRDLGADQVGAKAGQHRAEWHHAVIQEQCRDNALAVLLVNVLLDQRVVQCVVQLLEESRGRQERGRHQQPARSSERQQ
jgi:hypothetical protein